MILVIPSWILLLIATDAQAFAPRASALLSRTQTGPFCTIRLATNENQAECSQVANTGYEHRESASRRHRYHDLVTIVDSVAGQPITPWEDRYENNFSGEHEESGGQAQAVWHTSPSYQSMSTSSRAESNLFGDLSHARNELGGHAEYIMDQPNTLQEEDRHHRSDDLVHISDNFVDRPIIMQREGRKKLGDDLVQVVDDVRGQPRIMWKDRHDTYVASKGEDRLAAAAGVGAGVLGMMVAGPVGAVALGFSAAFAAEKEQGVVGDSARAMGDVALSAKEKAFEIEDKHHVSHKARVAAGEAWEMAKELDREHKILQKAKDVAIYGSKATADYVQRHNIVERGLVGIGKGACWISEVVANGSLSAVEDTNEAQSPKPSEMTVYKHIIG